MPYDAGSIFARIYARFDESGFDRFDRRVTKARADSAKPIDAELGADYRSHRLEAFERDLRGARRAAARPIVAHARVDYDPGPLRRFTLALGGAGGGINRFRRTLNNADDGMGGFNRRMLTLRNTMKLLTFPAAIAALGAVGGILNGLIASVVGLTSALGSLAGAAVLVPAGLGAMVQGLATSVLAFAGVGDALKALGDQQSKAGAAAADNSRAQEQAADRIADARQALTDAGRAEKRAQDELSEAWRQGRRDLEDLRAAASDAALAQQQAALDLARARDAAMSAVSADLTAGPRRDADDAGARIVRALWNMRQAAVDAARAMENLRASAMRALFGVRAAQLDLTRTQEAYNTAVQAGAPAEEQSRRLGDVEKAEWELAEAQRARAEAIEDINRAMNARMADAAERTRQREAIDAQRDQTRALTEFVRMQREQREQVRETALAERRAAMDLRDANVERRRTAEDLARARAAARPEQVIAAEERLRDAKRATERAARDLSRAQRDANESLGGGAAAADKVAEEMAKLPPAAQRFVRFLFSLKPRMDELRATAAKGLLPGVETGIRRAMRNFPALNRVIGLTARGLGRLAEQAGALVGSRAFGRDFERISATNSRLIGNMGRGAINLTSAFRHLLVAAGPFIRWFGDATERFTKYIEKQAQAGRETGRLAGFFDRLKVTMKLVGSILRDVGLALVRIGGIANRELGQHMLRGLDRASASLERWTRSTRGQNQIAKYFRDARPVADEFGRLIRDITVGLLNLGSGDQTAGLVRALRTKLLPALFELLEAANAHLGPVLIEMFREIALIVARIAPALGGALRAISAMAGMVRWVVDNVPGVKQFVAALLLLRGLYFALRIAATLSGLSTIVKLLKQIGVLSAVTGGAGAAGAARPPPAGGGLTKGSPLATGAAGGWLTRLGAPTAAVAAMGTALLGAVVAGGKLADTLANKLLPGSDRTRSALHILTNGLAGTERVLGRVQGAADQTGASIRRAFGPIPAQVAAGARAMERTGVRGARTLARALAQIPAVKRLRFFMADVDVRRRLSSLSDLVKRLVGEKWVVRILTNAPNAVTAVRAFRAILRGVPPEKVVKILQNAPNARSAVRRLTEAIKNTPKERKIEFSTPGLKAALDRIDRLRRWLDDLRGQGAVVPFTGAGRLVPSPSQVRRQKGGTRRLTLEDLEEMRRQKGNRGGKAGPGTGKAGPQVVVYGEGNKQEWWISQEGDRQKNVLWAVEALEKLTGRKVTLAAGGAASRRGRGKRIRDPLTGRMLTVPKSQQSGMYTPAGRFGSRTLRGRVNALIAALEPKRTHISNLIRGYEQSGRRFTNTEEILLSEDPNTGDLIVNAEEVEKQAREFDELQRQAGVIQGEFEALRNGYAKIVGQTRNAIAFFEGQVRDLRKRFSRARPRDKGFWRRLLNQSVGNLRAFRGWLPQIQQSEVDARLDRDDWQITGEENRDQAAAVRATQGTTAPRIGTEAGGGDTGPSPEDVARAAFEQYQTFQASRASLTRDFGANFLRTGGTMDATAQEYAPRSWGAFGAEQGAGGGQSRTEINVTNNYASGPGDPHTWSQDQKWQLSTMGI